MLSIQQKWSASSKSVFSLSLFSRGSVSFFALPRRESKSLTFTLARFGSAGPREVAPFTSWRSLWVSKRFR